MSEETGWGRLDGSLLAVAVEVLRHGPLPRAELSRRLGLSPGSLTRLTRPLVDDGLLVEGGPELQRSTGRPSVPLDVRPTGVRFAGVKITADELFAVVTDLRASVLDRRTVALPGRSPDDVVRSVAAVVDDLARTHGPVAGIGVGIAGLVTEHRDVVVSPFLGWTGAVPLAALLGEATGVPVSVDNDVRALTAAEHWFGQGRGLHSFALVTIGAGVGCGLVVHDRQVCGARGRGGRIGHLPLVASAPGGPCDLGHPGCAQALLGTGGLTAAAAARLGHPVTHAELLGLAGAGDPGARTVLDDAARGLAQLVTAVTALSDPELVLISGEGAELLEVSRAAFDEEIARIGPGQDPVPVRIAPFGFTDWARGAAVVAVQDHVRGDAPVG
ncbi:putative NBD/HSP70 family sugar kinase [Pseudonocardia sediminis]|uniref:Putative NBD/HSP70 family sugar kinase n=1 Tax=Pseudonocardia sediminis TaxID=1397368 RepID=A0A4Q7UXS4_PSEST|nr:putative NBD/HSP70 family sugar kinase [Pseudonocardia sediminis]